MYFQDTKLTYRFYQTNLNYSDLQFQMMRVMGAVPNADRRVPADVQTLGDEVRDGLTYRKISFATEPGDRCPAWLILPKAAATAEPTRHPAMLCLHQTTKIGKDEPAGLGGKANLHYARELAERGYVVFVPDYPGYGEYHIDPYAMGYDSTTMKGIWNHLRAMDVICDLPMVDPDRVGCIGHSLGGHNALFLATFDERVRVAVSSGGFTLFTWNDDERRGERGDLSDWSHKGYMPWIRERFNCRVEDFPFDWDEVLESICPRAVFINAPEDDFMRVEGVRECMEKVQPTFDAAGASIACVHPPCEHDFPPDVRAQAYAFVDRCLGHVPMND